MSNNFVIFGMNATKKFAQEVAAHVDLELSKHREEYFPDREPYVMSEVNVRNSDVFVIQSLYTDEQESVSDKFTKLLFFIGSLKDASAKRVCAVIPYLAFSRMDRKTESRAPITTKYLAKQLEAAGTDRLLTMDVHNLSAFQNSFRIQTDTLEAKNLLADFVTEKITETDITELVVLSPDSGGMGRARQFRQSLERRCKQDIGLAYLDKTHQGKIIHGHEIIGDVTGKYVVVIDDMISSGATIVECEKAISAKKGKLWLVCGTHGLFVGKIHDNLSKIDQIVVTDTINRMLPGELSKKVGTITTARLFGQAIRRIHDQGGSISDLLEDN